MKTLHVGGMNPIRRFKTLAEALVSAQNDDTIEIHKNLNESVLLQKSIIINGHGHTLRVPDGKIGIKAERSLELADLNFETGNRAVGIDATDDLYLSRVNMTIVGPVRKFTPTLQLSAKINAAGDEYINHPSMSVGDSKLQKVYTGPNTTSKFENVDFIPYYDSDVALTDRTDMSYLLGNITILDSRLQSIVIGGDAEIKNPIVKKYIDIEGEVEMTNPIFEIESKPFDPKNFKKEPKSGPLQSMRDAYYGLSLSGEGQLTLKNYKIARIDEPFLGIYSTGGSLTVENTYISDDKAKHVLQNTTLSLKDVKDKSYWDISAGTAAYVRSEIGGNSNYETAMDKLKKMTGQNRVKEQVQSIMNTIEMNRKTNNKDFEFSYNMIFAGSPGTGKSTIARIVAQALFEIGAIPENKFTQATSDEFVQGYVGQTGQHTREILDKALGGVLFIDEAYELAVKDNQNSFNSEVLTVLIRYMEDHRSDLIVIAAGYNDEMKDFLASNVGLDRRFQWIQFDDYTNEEMAKIFNQMRLSTNDEYEDPETEKLIVPLFTKLTETNFAIPDAKGHRTNGGNGGLVRNVYQAIIQARNNRVANDNSTMLLTQTDVVVGFKSQIEKALLRQK